MAEYTDPLPTDKDLPNTNAVIRQTDCQYTFGKENMTAILKFKGTVADVAKMAAGFREGYQVKLSDVTKYDGLGQAVTGITGPGKVVNSNCTTTTGCAVATIVISFPYDGYTAINISDPPKRTITTWNEKSTDYEFPLEIYAGEDKPNAGDFEAWKNEKNKNIQNYKEFKYVPEGQTEAVELDEKTKLLAQKWYAGIESVRRAYPEVIRVTNYINYQSGKDDQTDKTLFNKINEKPNLYYIDTTPSSVWSGKFKDFSWLKASYDINTEATEYEGVWNITVTESWLGLDPNDRGGWDTNLYGQSGQGGTRWQFASTTPKKAGGKDSSGNTETTTKRGRVNRTTFQNQTDLVEVDLANQFHAVDANSFSSTSTRSLRSTVVPALQTIRMPEVSFIGDDAFNGAANLQDIDLENQISYLGERVFKDCTSMEMAIVLPDIYDLPASTFEGCTSLNAWTGDDGLIIGGSVVTIGESCFKDCSSLEKVICQNAITSIGANAFDGDVKLASFSVPTDSTGSITLGDEAFKGCEKLADIEIPVGTITVGTDTFDGAFDDEVTVKAPKSFLTNLPNTSSYNYIYPAFVTSIANDEFKDDTRLKSVVFSDAITASGNNSFNGCTSLEKVVIGSGITTFGNYVFQGCSSLTDVTLGENQTQLGIRMFFNCTSLETLTLPETVTNIRNEVFRNCTSLTSLELPEGLTNLGNTAFQACTALKSVIMPENETGSLTLGDSVFTGCSALERVDLPVGTLTVGSTTFSNALASECWIKAPFNSNLVGSIPSGKLVNYIYPSFTTSIAANEWKDNTKLKSVALPDTITNIGHDAFRNTSITTFTVPPLITTLVYQMFYQCLTLESLDLNNVTEVGADICNGCSALDELLNADKLVTIGQRAFMGTAITEFTGGSNLATVGASAFKNCTALTEATFPAATTSMGATVFQGCTSLTEITMTGKEMATVQGMTNYPFGLTTGQVIHCSDGDITI